MASVTAPLPQNNQRGVRNRVPDPYSKSAQHPQQWTPPSWVVVLIVTALFAVISVVYVNLRDDIKGIKDDVKELRASQSQLNRDITDLRVGFTRITTQLDQILQRLPQK